MNIEIPAPVNNQLHVAAAGFGKTPESIALNAVAYYVDDLLLILDAEKRFKNGEKQWSNDDLLAGLDLVED